MNREIHAEIEENALIICNGYKDENYIELALLAQKMGRRIYLVVEKLNELKLIATIAKRIKDMTFQLARMRWPKAKIFSLTSGAAVMKMNTELGYAPVTFADLTDDEAFWRGCNGCINHDILERTGRKYCICTAMLYDPEDPHRAQREAAAKH